LAALVALCGETSGSVIASGAPSTMERIVLTTHYDLETLAGHVPAAFIATPVLKATGPLMIPALDGKSKTFSWWDINKRETFYIYGGYWLAEYESPKGLRFNTALGHSANQENITGSPAVGLQVDDQVFQQPAIVEGV
jgi:D-serine deaminase-like pyridoxal phosphate-dependent protein